MPDPPDLPARQAWEPLDLPFIERKPKIVLRDDDFVVAVALNERQQRDYAAIIGLIRVGGDLGPYYRRSTTADRLLRTLQVVHLHLGGPGSDAILYVVQYPGHVLLVRVDSHIHLDDLPPGKRLPLRGRKRFQSNLQSARSNRAERLAEATTRLTGLNIKPKPGDR